MRTVSFVNEIGNKIRIRIKNHKGVGTNYKTKKQIKYDGVNITLIGPTSESNNSITYGEALTLFVELGKYMKNQNLEAYIDMVNIINKE